MLHWVENGWMAFLRTTGLQQLREAIPSDHPYRFLIRDRDAIFSMAVDEQLKALGLKVLRTPAHAPKANAYCERLVGTVPRECLDFIIPLGEKQLGTILTEWVTHYNQGRPHLSLGPGIPESAENHSFATTSPQTFPGGRLQGCGSGDSRGTPSRIQVGKDCGLSLEGAKRTL